MTLLNPARSGSLIATLAAVSLSSATAGTSVSMASGKDVAPPPAKEQSVFDKIWSLAKLYKNDSNPFLEEISVIGRYQGQYYNTDADTGNIDDWENRRFQLGLELALFDRTVKVKGEMASNDAFDPFYDGLRDAYIEYSPSKAFALRVGKFEPRFTREFSTSSKEILTLERSQLVNQFRPDYVPAVSLSGKADKISWYAAVSSNEVDNEFGEFNGGLSYFASLGYDLTDALGVEKADVRLDYTHSDLDALDNKFNAFDDGVSLSLAIKDGKWALVNDFIGGFADSGNAFSWVFMPSYDITDKLQAVVRYTLSLSDESNGLKPQGRYEKAAGGSNGDVYNAIGAGLNYYIYGQKMKLMAGTEYASLDGGTGAGYSGWTSFAAVRIYW